MTEVARPAVSDPALRTLRLVGAAALAIALVAGTAFAVVTTLPRPTEAERLAVRVVQRLQDTRSGGAVLHVDGRALVARCRWLSGSSTLVTLTNGERLVVARTRVHDRTRRAGRALTARRSPRDRELLAVKAALAGIHRLYAAALRGRLMRGDEVVVGSTVFRGERAYRVRVGEDPPAVELLVSGRTLDPVAATYRSRRVAAWSRLLQPGPHRRDRC